MANLAIDSNEIYHRFNSLIMDNLWKCPDVPYKTLYEDAINLKKIYEIIRKFAEIPKYLHVLTCLQIYFLLPEKKNKWNDLLSIFLLIEAVYTDNEKFQKKKNLVTFLLTIRKYLPNVGIPEKDSELNNYASNLYIRQQEIFKSFEYNIFNISLTINYINFFPNKDMTTSITYDVIEKNIELLIFTDKFENNNLYSFYFLSPKDFSLMIIHHADKIYDSMYHDKLYWINYNFHQINKSLYPVYCNM
jgi:hypothetical protein